MNDFQAWLAKRLDDIAEQMREDFVATRSHLASIDVTLAKNTADVEHHIKRTDVLEERVEQVASDVTPIKDHVDKVKTVMWFVRWTGGALVAALGAYATFKELF